MSVDNGHNWYDLCLPSLDWLNLGLPVGVAQMEALLDHYYQGEAKTALVLYHPNFWLLNERFKPWSETKGSVFFLLGWETRFWPCLRLKVKKDIRAQRELINGHINIFEYKRTRYHIDCRYSWFDFNKKEPMVMESLAAWERMLRRFAKVLIVRTPVKQELVPNSQKNGILQETLKSYDHGWELTRNYLRIKNSQIEFFEPQIFDIADYQPWDTHWVETGNERFAAFVRSLL
jgi:hypothetical protein